MLEMRFYLMDQNGRLRARRYRQSKDIKLHLGCGPRIKPGWVNIDLSKKADLQLDLRKSLPFRNESCSMIYSEHFLEHVDYPGPVTNLVMECWRVLKPGGVISVAVPDIELVVRSYLNGGSEEYYAAQRKWHPEWCRTQMEHMNYNFRQDGEHRFCYDVETITNLFEKCGFIDVKRRSFNPDLDSKDREVGSLYIQCTKPTN